MCLSSCRDPKQSLSEENTNALVSKVGTTDDQIIKRTEVDVDPKGQTISSRFIINAPYERTVSKDNSFAQYLRDLPLKPIDSPVLTYDGTIKPNHNIYDAVVDLPIGKKNLHQCADAVMRLRAEYLWSIGHYEDIHFNLTNGDRIDYSRWMEGYRISVQGNKTNWVKRAPPSNSYDDLWNYLELIFTYAGTLSLAKELRSKKTSDIAIGDVFIKGGSPGHAVIVVDLAVNKLTNKKIMLLAQSYMPAQEIQILKNPNDHKLSPWYSTQELEKLITPEWTFSQNQLKHF